MIIFTDIAKMLSHEKCLKYVTEATKKGKNISNWVRNYYLGGCIQRLVSIDQFCQGYMACWTKICFVFSNFCWFKSASRRQFHGNGSI